MEERLQKILSHAGVASRRQAEKIIAEGRVAVNGAVVTELGSKADLERDHIIEILRQTRGVLSGPKGAAARLGLKRTTLQYKMQKMGIFRSDYMD